MARSDNNSIPQLTQSSNLYQAPVESEIQRGLSLAPNVAGGHFAYGVWLVVMGRLDEAIAELERRANQAEEPTRASHEWT
jgi:hypothetical protein